MHLVNLLTELSLELFNTIWLQSWAFSQRITSCTSGSPGLSSLRIRNLKSIFKWYAVTTGNGSGAGSAQNSAPTYGRTYVSFLPFTNTSLHSFSFCAKSRSSYIIIVWVNRYDQQYFRLHEALKGAQLYRWHRGSDSYHFRRISHFRRLCTLAFLFISASVVYAYDVNCPDMTSHSCGKLHI
jgi:hypothetical protein